MGRRALFVGIDAYEHLDPMRGSVADMLALENVLARHANGAPNYTCKHIVSENQRVSRTLVSEALAELFATDDEVLFAFAGHGVVLPGGVYLATQDGNEVLPGIALRDLLALANASPAKEILLILDCCHAGAFGDALSFAGAEAAPFREGLTLLAAARAPQSAVEVGGHGMFTRLVIGALQGGGKDVRGRVTSASIYGFVDQALGTWEQRPMYKSNASRLATVRFCEPDVSRADLQRLPELFPTPTYRYQLDPRHEFQHPTATREHVAIFGLFKRYRNARLLRTVLGHDLYFAAMNRTHVALTPLGQYYWELAHKGLLDGDPDSPNEGSRSLPNAEDVARLFHETYERLAPSFDYRTRRATAVPWDDVPAINKQLMIAVATEVLAMLFPPEETLATSPEKEAL
jgi:hypothetical protein